jgi:hypothetical protein
MEALEEKLGATEPSEPAAAPVTSSPAISAGPPILTAPASPAASGAAPTAVMTSQQAEEKPSPLYFKIGGAEFYPLGFMDMTGFYRTRNWEALERTSVRLRSTIPSLRVISVRRGLQHRTRASV